VRSPRWMSCLLLLCVWAAPALAYPPFYSAREVHGQVVDDATGQPIAGVVVVAQWKLRLQVVLGAPGWDSYANDASDVLGNWQGVSELSACFGGWVLAGLSETAVGDAGRGSAT
jgi:hypothetical protein